MGFVIDGSASVEYFKKGNFQLIKDFIKKLTRFTTPIGETRVGAIVYSTNATLAFRFDKNASYGEVAEAIDNITYPGGGTYTGKALNEAATRLFQNGLARGQGRKLLVLITDGVSTDDVYQPALSLRNDGVLVFVVGIGEDLDYSQLNQIAGGNQEHVFTADFNVLEEIVNPVRGQMCKGTKTLIKTPAIDPRFPIRIIQTCWRFKIQQLECCFC